MATETSASNIFVLPSEWNHGSNDVSWAGLKLVVNDKREYKRMCDLDEGLEMGAGQRSHQVVSFTRDSVPMTWVQQSKALIFLVDTFIES